MTYQRKFTPITQSRKPCFTRKRGLWYVLSKWDFEVRVDFPSLKRAIMKLENACA